MPPPETERLFIKVILPQQGMEQRVPAGGSPPKPFRPVTATMRTRLCAHLAEEMVQVLRNRFQTQNLVVRPRVRLEAQP